MFDAGNVFLVNLHSAELDSRDSNEVQSRGAGEMNEIVCSSTRCFGVIECLRNTKRSKLFGVDKHWGSEQSASSLWRRYEINLKLLVQSYGL